MSLQSPARLDQVFYYLQSIHGGLLILAVTLKCTSKAVDVAIFSPCVLFFISPNAEQVIVLLCMKMRSGALTATSSYSKMSCTK